METTQNETTPPKKKDKRNEQSCEQYQGDLYIYNWSPRRREGGWQKKNICKIMIGNFPSLLKNKKTHRPKSCNEEETGRESQRHNIKLLTTSDKGKFLKAGRVEKTPYI